MPEPEISDEVFAEYFPDGAWHYVETTSANSEVTIALAVCAVCAATILLSPHVPDDVLRRHVRWHLAVEPEAVP